MWYANQHVKQAGRDQIGAKSLPKALIAAEATDVLRQRVPGREQMAMAALFLWAKWNREIAIWQSFGQVFIWLVDLDLQGSYIDAFQLALPY